MMKPGMKRSLLVFSLGLTGIVLYGVQWPFCRVVDAIDRAMDRILARASEVTGEKL